MNRHFNGPLLAPLTPKQDEVLRWIIRFIAEKRRNPTPSEVSVRMKHHKDKPQVGGAMIAALARAGYLHRSPEGGFEVKAHPTDAMWPLPYEYRKLIDTVNELEAQKEKLQWAVQALRKRNNDWQPLR